MALDIGIRRFIKSTLWVTLLNALDRSNAHKLTVLPPSIYLAVNYIPLTAIIIVYEDFKNFVCEQQSRMLTIKLSPMFSTLKIFEMVFQVCEKQHRPWFCGWLWRFFISLLLEISKYFNNIGLDFVDDCGFFSYPCCWKFPNTLLRAVVCLHLLALKLPSEIFHHLRLK